MLSRVREFWLMLQAAVESWPALALAAIFVLAAIALDVCSGE